MKIGTITWVDLTVPEADALRDFYADVTGWTPSNVDMGGYNDYCMVTPDNDAVAGICHARGTNAGVPPVWLVYINVADLDRSIQTVKDRGGEIVNGPRSMGEHGRYCIIRDPAGAVAALFEPKR